MKGIMRAILLVAVLCLAGCSSEEDPQSVAFSVKEMEVDGSSHRLTIGIVANCPWTITDEKDKTFTETKEGSGSLETTLVVFYNPDFDNKTYTVTLTSQDGTSTDVLTVRQAGQLGLEVGTTGMIEAEGGTFDIPVRTNDDITNIDAPDWITFTSSRGLTGYTYTFTAQPNQTGSVRSGQVTLKGTGTSDAFEVEQDSYAPTGIIVNGLPKKTTVKEHSVSLQLEPSYADWSKLSVSSDNKSRTELNENNLTVSLKNYGESNIKFYADQQEIGSSSITLFPASPLYSQTMQMCIGDKKSVSLVYPHPDFVFTSSNPDVVQITDDNMLLGTGVGTSVITVKHPELGIEDNMTVDCDWIQMRAEVSHLTGMSGAISVALGARVECGYPLHVDSFIVTDNENRVVLANQGTVRMDGNRDAVIVTELLYIPSQGSNNALDVLKGYKFYVTVSIEGHDRSEQRGVLVNYNSVGSIQ